MFCQDGQELPEHFERKSNRNQHHNTAQRLQHCRDPWCDKGWICRSASQCCTFATWHRITVTLHRGHSVLDMALPHHQIQPDPVVCHFLIKDWRITSTFLYEWRKILPSPHFQPRGVLLALKLQEETTLPSWTDRRENSHSQAVLHVWC